MRIIFSWDIQAPEVPSNCEKDPEGGMWYTSICKILIP